MVTLRAGDGRCYARIEGGRLTLAEGGAEELAKFGRLELPELTELTELPPGLTVRGLNLRGCTGLTRLPEGLVVRHLVMAGCTGLVELPAGLSCYELDLSGTRLRSLPEDLRVEYRLGLGGCTALEELPAGLAVGSLGLRGCTALTALPEGLDVHFLDLQGCKNLTTWPDSARVRFGRLDLGGCARLRALPETLGPLAQLDVSDCNGLTDLPEGLRIGTRIELANTAIAGLPPLMEEVELRWRGVTIDQRIAFRPESIAVAEVLAEENAERRRVLLERVGLERFLAEADARVLDEDRDPGGIRRLLLVPMRDDEPLVCVLVHCPSTGGRYLLRVPPALTTCRAAVAWTAGFDSPDLYRPLVES